MLHDHKHLRVISATVLSVCSTVLFVSSIGIWASSLIRQTYLPGECIPKFAVPLPVFGPAGSIPRVDAASHRDLTVTMREIDQRVLPVGMRDTCGLAVTFGRTRVWTYETSDSRTREILGPANWPAVTIDAKRYIPVRVTYVNELPSFIPRTPYRPGPVQALLDVDQTLHWANPLNTPGCGMPLDCTLLENADNPCCKAYTGPQPVTVHLHGAEIATCYDGGPDTWWTPDGRTGPEFCTDGRPGRGKAIYTYNNHQEPGTLWFHDHVLGATSHAVYGALAGFYFIRDRSAEPKRLPSGPYEIEMAMQDRVFDTNSQLAFSKVTGANVTMDPTTPHFHPFWHVRLLGDVAIVNGAAWPYLEVEPRRYRFRILNGANSRRFDLHLGNAPVWQIGADDNYLDEPVRVNDTACAGGESTTRCSDVSLLPGERADIIVDFTNLAGQTVTVTNDTIENEVTSLTDVMQFRVALPLRGPDESCDPAHPDPINGFCARPNPMVRLTDGHGHVAPGVRVDKVRQLVVNEIATGGSEGMNEQFVNNTLWDGLESPSIAAEFPTDGISELPRVGSTERWDIVNSETTAEGQVQIFAFHPIHTHLVQFQILNRQRISAVGYEEAWDEAFPESCPHEAGFCPGYGPPLPYRTPNGDGAIGGNPAVSPYLLGDPMPPDPGESGWKDTVRVFPGQVTRLLVRWTPTSTPVVPHRSYAGQNLFPFDPTVGQYVWHCHILGHEDNEMMRPYKVVGSIPSVPHFEKQCWPTKSKLLSRHKSWARRTDRQ